MKISTHAQTKVAKKILPQPEIKKNAGWKPYLVLTIFAFILYGNTLNHSFALDDELVITNNVFTQQGVKGIPNFFKYDLLVGYLLTNKDKTKTVEQLQDEMKLEVGGRYRPLSLITFALEVQFFGKKNSCPDGYEFKANAFVSHLNNILLYLFTTCLLYLILCRLFPIGRWYLSFPFIVTLLFLAHPIHTECVANIKGRDEIMALLGALAALWFTIKYFDTNKIYNLWLSGLCLFFGLLSKENVITFLAIIPITIYYFVASTAPSHQWGKIFKSMLPLIVVSVIYLLIRTTVLGLIKPSEITPNLLNNPFLYATKSETFATIFYILLLYIKLLFFPHPLTWDYYPYHIEIVNWTNPIAILSLLFYLGITALAIYGLMKHATVKSTNPQINKLTIISYSIWFYLLPLTIVSNLFFPTASFMAERFMFVSSIGFCIFVGWLIYYFSKCTQINKSTNPQINKSTTYITYFILFIILCLFSVKTISRNMAWKDSFTLVSIDVKTSKNSIRGNFATGSELMKKIVYPDNKNEIKKRDGLCDEAVQYLKRTIELYPKEIQAITQLAYLYFDCYKDIAKSLHCYAMVLKNSNATINTSEYYAAKYILNQTDLLLNSNEIPSTPSEIIQSCDELLEAKPDFGEAYYIKGLMYAKYLNNKELGLINFEKALSLDFEKTATFYKDIGVFYGISANYEKAVQCLLKAIELNDDPNDYVTFRNLGIFYQKLGDMKNADFYLIKSNEMHPKNL